LRTLPNDTRAVSQPIAPVDNAIGSAKSDGNSGDSLNTDSDSGGAERRCVLTGERAPRDLLIRLALGPDNSIAPDLLARAPGRGAWIGVARPALDIAQAKGKLDAALSRAFKTAVKAPADLADRIDAGFARLVSDRLGLDVRSGHLIMGADKIDQAAREGRVALLLHAADAAEDGRRKRDQSWRIGQDAEGSGLCGTILPMGRDALSAALGRENAVHLALIDTGAAARTGLLLQRWRIFAQWDKDPGE
jgi:uncharacterized protein